MRKLKAGLLTRWIFGPPRFTLRFFSDKSDKPDQTNQTNQTNPKHIQISKEDLERITLLVKGFDQVEQEGSNASEQSFFKTSEQIISFKLLQTKNTEDVLAVLRSISTPVNPSELFLIVYSYAKFSSPLDKAMLPHFNKVLEELNNLESSALIKVHELLYQYRKEMEALQQSLPEIPKPRQIPSEDLLQFIYFLCKLYPQSPDLDGWIDMISSEAAASNPTLLNQIVECLEQPHTNLNDILNKTVEQCQDDSQIARLIVHNLQKGKIQFAAKCAHKLSIENIDPDLYVNVLYQLHQSDVEKTDQIVNQKRNKDSTSLSILKTKLFEHLPLIKIQTCSKESYVTLWTLLTKLPNPQVISKLTQIELFQNIEVSQIPCNDLFTVFISSSFLNVKESSFLVQFAESIIAQSSQFSADQIFYLYMSAHRLGLQDTERQLKKLAADHQPKMSPRNRQRFQKHSQKESSI